MKKEFVMVILFVLFLSLAAHQSSPQLFVTSGQCTACHNQLSDPQGKDISIGSDWSGSMMANSARDPYWQAAIRREILEHPSASRAIQHECAACHMPMTRYLAKIQGLKGEVLPHFPIAPNDSPNHELAADGVSCTLCHQIQDEKLGIKDSFTAGFVIDKETPMGQRQIFGPQEVDEGRKYLMQSSSRFIPQKAGHVESSEFCASCHTLYTHTLNEKGEVIGTLPEQVPYLEWKHSEYPGKKNCQSCHMPQLDTSTNISSVMGIPREHFARHVFRGGNILIPRILNRHRSELGVKALPQNLQATEERSRNHLETGAAEMKITRSKISEGNLILGLEIENQAGHKLPTAYPSRRIWIHISVKDNSGRTVFESGKLNQDGSIEGNANDSDKKEFEPHFLEISRPDQVQIYEAILGDEYGSVTTILLSGIRYLKDNRITPAGFNKKTAHKDCAVYGDAEKDQDFQDSRDHITYLIKINPTDGPFHIQAELYYQPIGYRWVQNLKEQPSQEADRFISYFRALSCSSFAVLSRTAATVSVKPNEDRHRDDSADPSN